MLDNDGIGISHHGTTGDFAFVYGAGTGAANGLQVNSLVIDSHMLVDRVLVLAKVPADISFLHRPGESSLIGLEATCNELLLLRECGCGAYLLGNHLLDLLVEGIHFLLLLFLLSEEVLLLCLQRFEHIFLFALIACEFVLFAFL